MELDYPEFDKEIKELWDALKTGHFFDERDVKSIYVKILRLIAVINEERARCLLTVKQRTEVETADFYDKNIRSMVLRGMAQNEREKMYILGQPYEVRIAMLKMQELDRYLESMRRIESILRGILDCIRVELKLSYEGHE